MKKLVAIIVLQLFLFSVRAGSIMEIQQQKSPVDTGIIKDPIEEEIIAEVIKTKAPPQKEKIQYFSQVTKYGFKNSCKTIITTNFFINLC